MKKFYLLVFTLALLQKGAGSAPAFGAPPNSISFAAGQARTGLMSFKLIMNPGEQRQEVVEVKNHNQFPLDFRVYATQSQTSPSGQLQGPMFGEPVQDEGKWIVVQGPQITLAGGAKGEVGFTVSVPPGALPGDHVAFVMVEPTSESVTANSPDPGTPQRAEANFRIRIGSRFALAVVVRVPGEVKPSLVLGEANKGVTDDGKLYIQIPIKNDGNVYLKPFGKWSLLGPDGQPVRQADRKGWGLWLPGATGSHQILLDDPGEQTQPLRPLPRGEYTLDVNVEARPDQDLKPVVPSPTEHRQYRFVLP